MVNVNIQQAAELVRTGDIASLERLPDSEAEQLATKVDEDERTLLHTAASVGNPQMVEFFLQRNCAAVNRADEEGWTPLLSAASAGHDAVVETLITAGADPSAQNNSGRTALHYAASKGRPSMVSLLLQKGAPVNAQDELGATPLHRACSAGKVATVRELVERGHASLAVKDRQGQTPLFVACAANSRAAALYLASKGADVEAEDKEKETPLSAAAAFAGLRESLVDLVLGKTSIEDVLQD